jgi:hypothetical protein
VCGVLPCLNIVLVDVGGPLCVVGTRGWVLLPLLLLLQLLSLLILEP